MTEYWWVDPLITATIVAAMLWLLEPFAYRLGLLDRPGGRKDHSHPTPIIGGVAMAIGIIAPVVFVGTYPRSYLGFMLGAALLVLIGLIDDVRDVRWWWRILAQIAAALVMIYVGGVRVEYLGQVFGAEAFDLGIWSVPFTVIATVGVINAFNMCDGVDGLAGSLAVAALTMYCAAAIYSGNTFMVDRLAPVIAAISVFLVFNLRHPWRARARVFMGNAGSAFLGYLIAWVCFRLTQNQAHPVTPVLAPWLVAPPIVDCLVLIARRLKEGRSPFSAGRDHMHHLLLDAGFSPTQVALGLTFVSCAFGFSAALTLKSDRVPDTFLVLAFIGMTIAYYQFSRDRERAVARLRRLRTLFPFFARIAPYPSVEANYAGSSSPSAVDLSGNRRVAIAGLGPIGLRQAARFGHRYATLGYDPDTQRIAELRDGFDRTMQLSAAEIAAPPLLQYADTFAELADCNTFVVADAASNAPQARPDLTWLLRISAAIAAQLKRGDLVIYESRLHPSTVEDICGPTLEEVSGLTLGVDFHVGRSPTQARTGEPSSGSSDALVLSLYRTLR